LRFVLVVTLLAGLAHTVGRAAMDADPKAGSAVFETTCSDCHSVKPGRHKSGPSLFGVTGRASAASEGFTYSDALRNAGVVWTPETLDSFITNPKALVPQTRMRFSGLSNPRSRADLLAYLETQK
jgi:cytochrome c